MESVPLFIRIDYARPSTFAENTLSSLSHYFSLGANRVTVIFGDVARLDSVDVSWFKTALKVVSYVLLFPLTLTLLAIHLILRNSHTFTMIATPQKDPESNPSPTQTTPTNPTDSTTKPSSSTKVEEPVKDPAPEIPKPETKPPSTTTTTAQNVETVRQQIIIPPPVSEKKPFIPFAIKISEVSLPPITSEEEMHKEAEKLGKQVTDGHLLLQIAIPFGLCGKKTPETVQALEFIEELKKSVDVLSTRFEGCFYLVPKKTEENFYFGPKGTEKIQENLIIRTYTNGVVEEVHSSWDKEIENGWTEWNGCRTYPDGIIVTGRFQSFKWKKGTRVENGTITYRDPNILISNTSLDRALIYAGINGEKLIVTAKKPDSDFYDFDYVEVKEELMPTLAKMLQDKESSPDYKKLKEVLSGPIDCAQFVNYLFNTNTIFSLNSYSFEHLLKISQFHKLAVNLRHQHPETKETLLDRYSKSVRTLKSLLAMDPTLIQRVEGVEIAFVRALLAGNKEGATLLFTTMEEQGISLTSQELLFKKVGFAEGNVTLEALQKLSPSDQEIVYKLANTHSQLHVVQMMRTLGFGRQDQLLMSEGPSIFGYNMDALEMHEQLHSFLTQLRSENLILTQTEFGMLPKENFVEEANDIGRLLGRNYIEKKAQELGLKWVKVPKKMIVLDDKNTELKLCTTASLDLRVVSRGVTVYADKIQAVKRTVTSEEVSELNRLFEATGFSSFNIDWANVIVAKDGLYIIDTQFDSFWNELSLEGGGQYVPMSNIIHALPEDHQQPLIEELAAKCMIYFENEEKLKDQRELGKKAEQAALAKTGCLHGLTFTFAVNELMK